MATEVFELNNDLSAQIEVLMKEVADLEDMINNPKKHGIFDELLISQLRDKLHAKQEELSLKTIDNIQ
jgi:hypothetical protein